jgi:hypothetical protein
MEEKNLIQLNLSEELKEKMYLTKIGVKPLALAMGSMSRIDI